MKEKKIYAPPPARRIDGNVLYELRRKHGITRKEFAEWSGYGYKSLSKWEKPYSDISPMPSVLFMLKAYILHKSGLVNIEDKFKEFEKEHGLLGERRKAA